MIVKKYRIFLLLFSLLGVTSCSSKLLYNNLDWITFWYIDDYVTLTDTQETAFEPALKQFLDWHRQSELQNYVVQIKYVKLDIKNGINQADINGYIVSLKSFWQTLLIRIEPALIKLAYSLKDEQVAEFLAEVEQRNLDKIEEFEELTQAERLADRLERIDSRFESYIGELTAKQKRFIKEANDSSLSTFTEWMAYRRAWANSIREAYALRPDKMAFEQALSRSILQTDTLRSPVYWKKIEHNQNVWVVMLEKLILSLSTKQMKKLNEKLDDTIENLEALF